MESQAAGNIPQADILLPKEGQSRPSTEVSPAVSGGGTASLVGQTSADPSQPNPASQQKLLVNPEYLCEAEELLTIVDGSKSPGGSYPEKAPALAQSLTPSSTLAFTDAEVERITRICVMQCMNMINAQFEALEVRLFPAENLRPPLAAGRKKKRAKTKPINVASEPISEQVEAFAYNLTGVNNAEDFGASLPMQTAELYVDRLDDAATAAEVVAAVAQAAGCPPEDVRSIEIGIDSSGLPAITVQCPVAAAKKVAKAKRLLVGWVSARVKLLRPRPDAPMPRVHAESARTDEIAQLQVTSVAAEPSSEQVDIFPDMLAVFHNAKDVRTSITMQTAELYVDNLYDAATEAEVVAAVAQAGECSPEDVRIVEMDSGLPAIRVQCPVAVAKKVAKARRIVVGGWFSVRVKPLKPRPDASMPQPRRQPDWWTDEIAQLRVAKVAARRQYTRYRRRRRKIADEEAALNEVYRAAEMTLRLAINEAKTRVREEGATKNLEPGRSH